MSHVLAIIPARFASTRLPGKPLALIQGEPMIWHVYSQAAKALGPDNVLVATDHRSILQAVTLRGGNALITSPDLDCGTARCAEALRISGLNPDLVINLQADEPLINPADILKLVRCFDDPLVDIATLARPFNPTEGFDSLFSPDNPKVVFDDSMNALYFSRSIIPYVRDVDWQQWIHSASFHIHVGSYAFRPHVLRRVAALPPSSLEKAEKLEQLRWLQAGLRIRIALTQSHCISIDTPDDLEIVRRIFNSNHT